MGIAITLPNVSPAATCMWQRHNSETIATLCVTKAGRLWPLTG